MTVWIALLRGVNVGGVTIRSADLADLFRSLGFEGVRTVLASGNVRFETGGGSSARAKLKSRIENDPFAEFDVCSVAFHLKSTQVEGAGTMLPDAEAQVPISAATLVALGLVRVVLFS